MVNQKSLVFIVFAVWSVICWRWYVCGLMNACDLPADQSNEIVAATPEEPAAAPLEEEPTPEIKPVNPGTNTKSTPAATQPVSADRMDEVQVESINDKMVIYYPYKSSKKEENASIDAYLDQLAQQLRASGGKVTITGHTDFVGEPDENYRFGLLRANGIRDLLVKKGVPAAQIRCKSMGDKKPIATNDTPYGRYQNRRVEILVGK
ncbi:MAG TPA: OmpA family protein [Saprospiraceae bacterium]|nr:OmpA family protein [Saprospiraceae bacterium]